jgi:hypothetical protein
VEAQAHLQLINDSSAPHYRSKSTRRKSAGNPNFNQSLIPFPVVAPCLNILWKCLFPASVQSAHCPVRIALRPFLCIQSRFVSIFTAVQCAWTLHFPLFICSFPRLSLFPGTNFQLFSFTWIGVQLKSSWSIRVVSASYPFYGPKCRRTIIVTEWLPVDPGVWTRSSRRRFKMDVSDYCFLPTIP